MMVSFRYIDISVPDPCSKIQTIYEVPEEEEEDEETDMRDSLDIPDMRYLRDSLGIRDIREIRDVCDSLDICDPRDISDTHDTRDLRDTRDPRDTYNPRDPRDILKADETQDAGDPVDPRYIRDTHDAGDPFHNQRYVLDTDDTRDADDTHGPRKRKIVRSIKDFPYDYPKLEDKRHAILWVWIWLKMGEYFWWVVPHEILHGVGGFSQALLLGFSAQICQEIRKWTAANRRNTDAMDECPPSPLTVILNALFFPNGSTLEERVHYYGTVSLILSIIQFTIPFLFYLADLTRYNMQVDPELKWLLKPRARGFFCVYTLFHLLVVMGHTICLLIIMNDLYLRHGLTGFFYIATASEIIWNGEVLFGFVNHL